MRRAALGAGLVVSFAVLGHVVFAQHIEACRALWSSRAMIFAVHHAPAGTVASTSDCVLHNGGGRCWPATEGQNASPASLSWGRSMRRANLNCFETWRLMEEGRGSQDRVPDSAEERSKRPRLGQPAIVPL